MKAARQTFTETLASIEPERLVFIDESGAKTNLTPRHGWALRGERVVAHVPHGHWTTTMIGPFAWVVWMPPW